MNYSYYQIVQRQKMLRSNTRRVYSLLRITFFRLALMFMAFCMIVGTYGAYGAYLGIIRTSPSIDSISVTPEGFPSTIYYADGSVCLQLVGAGSNREYVSIDEIPKDIQNCFVALEDERFYEHSGIDIRGIFRAAFSVVKVRSLDYGASTITQQLLKNQVFSGGNEKSAVDKVVRKLQEQYLAIKLESKYSKPLILEYYLNIINLGNGAYGIQRAAQTYFGKNVDELTISEAAVLAPIAWSPVYMNPLKYPEDNARRRKDCLDNMLENNFCTKEQYDIAIADTEDVYLRIGLHSQYTEGTNNSYYSYFVDELIEQVVEDLQKQGYSSYDAYRLLYNGGLQIYSTQDKDIQAVMDKYYQDEEHFPAVGKGSYYELSESYALSIVATDGTSCHYHLKDLLEYYADYKDAGKLYYHEKGSAGINKYTLDKDDLNQKIDAFIEAMKKKFEKDYPGKEYRIQESRSISLQPQSAMVIMDPSTGDVVAQYGGRGKKVGNRVLNRASGTYRQAGSTFKVLASFLPALDTCGFTLASTFDDSYYEYPDQENIDEKDRATVTNWYRTGFEGLQSIRKGIYHSMNIIAARCMEQVTPYTAMSYLEDLGFSQLDTDPSDGVSDYTIALALGGLSTGCSVLEMTAAYAAIANEGIYHKPRYYSQILSYNGNVMISNKVKSSQVMKTSTAYLLTNAMEDTTKIGTGTKSRFQNLNIPVAGKTGTAHDNYDLWFAGFTPYYCAAIWSGFDNNFSQTNSSYYRYLWRDIMEEVHVLKGCEEKGFEAPSSIVSAKICTKCGNLAVEGLCDQYEGGSCVAEEIFAKGTVPYQSCTCHTKVTICTESNSLATETCPGIVSKVYLNKTETELSKRHGGTQDTAYILPESLTQLCPLHEGNPLNSDN